MINFKYFSFIFIFFISFSINSNEVEIIELHKNPSLDQLVLEANDSDQDNLLKEDTTQKTEENTNNKNEDKITSSDLEENDQINQLSDDNEILSESSEISNVDISSSQTIYDLTESSISFYLEMINDIKSMTLQKEFKKILSNPQLENQENKNNNLYFVIKKLYEMGEIGKANNLINANQITDNKHIDYFHFIKLNYLFSTFKLADLCEYKSSLLEESVILPYFLLEKTDIFCLTLENNLAEARLLNSLLLETENVIDNNFQKLFNFMISDEKDNLIFEPLKEIKNKELIFLYSAMLRINELALDEEFIEIDPLNLLIPVILSNSTNIDIRIKAANKAYYDELISIDSLSALYQSADFNSKDFNNPEQTINSLKSNKELIMAFYYQLANIQIFPDQRLNVVLDYWKFAKNFGLEKIAYDISKNIINSFTPSMENIESAMDIALANISNKQNEEALEWINLFEKSETDNEEVKYVKFLIALNQTNELDVIVNFLSNNFKKSGNLNNQKNLETFEVLLNFLKIENSRNNEFIYDLMIDDRLMPSLFLLKDIKKYLEQGDDLSLFMLSLISINGKKWNEIHPEHLSLVLNVFNSYDQGSLIKSITLEILDDLEIYYE